MNWRNRRERACIYCGQLKEYPTLPIPPLLTPLPRSPEKKYLFLFRADSSLFLFTFIFETLISHIFLIIIIIIRCCKMFRNVPGCSMFLVLSTAVNWTQNNNSTYLFFVCFPFFVQDPFPLPTKPPGETFCFQEAYLLDKNIS